MVRLLTQRSHEHASGQGLVRGRVLGGLVDSYLRWPLGFSLENMIALLKL
jgi:hypothetical protein